MNTLGRTREGECHLGKTWEERNKKAVPGKDVHSFQQSLSETCR